jgi:hypothetical protein
LVTLETVMEEISKLKLNENEKISPFKIFGNLNLLIFDESPKKKIKKISYIPFSTNQELFLDISEYLRIIEWKSFPVNERIQIIKTIFENYIFPQNYRNHCIFWKPSYSFWSSLKVFSIDYFFQRCGFGKEQQGILNDGKKIKFEYFPPTFECLFNFHEEVEVLVVKYWCFSVTETEYFVGLCTFEINEDLAVKVSIDPKTTWSVVRKFSVKENLLKDKMKILKE